MQRPSRGSSGDPGRTRSFLNAKSYAVIAARIAASCIFQTCTDVRHQIGDYPGRHTRTVSQHAFVLNVCESTQHSGHSMGSCRLVIFSSTLFPRLIGQLLRSALECTITFTYELRNFVASQISVHLLIAEIKPAFTTSMASLLKPTSGHAPDPTVPKVTPDDKAKYDDVRTQRAVEWVRLHQAACCISAG